MKNKKIKILIILLIFVLISGIFLINVSAETVTGNQNEEVDISDEFEDFITSLPEDMRSLLPKTAQDGKNISAGASEISDPGFIFGAVSSILGTSIDEAVRLLAKLCGLIFISAVFASMSKGQASEDLGKTSSMLISLVFFISVFAFLPDLMSRIGQYLTSLTSVCSASIPLMGILWVSGGAVNTAANGSVLLNFFLAFMENICAGTVIPFCNICMTLTLSGAIAGENGNGIKGLAGFIKKTYTTVLAFAMVLFTAVMSAQTTLSVRSDSISMKAARFAASSFIPLVGGAVGDSLKTLGASVDLLKSGVGTILIFSCVLMLLRVLVPLILYRCVMNLASFAGESVGLDGTSCGILKEIGSIYGYLASAVSICTVTFILSVSIFVKCASPISQ